MKGTREVQEPVERKVVSVTTTMTALEAEVVKRLIGATTLDTTKDLRARSSEAKVWDEVTAKQADVIMYNLYSTLNRQLNV